MKWGGIMSTGLPMNIMSMLPHLVEHYEDPTKMDVEAAERIADVSKIVYFFLFHCSLSFLPLDSLVFCLMAIIHT